MRWVAVGLFPLLIGGCGAKYKAKGPVISSYERAVNFPVHRPHEQLVYSGREPASAAPIIPLMAFGAAFDLDVVLMPRSGDFDMIEFARLNMPDRQLWLALETTEAGEQTVVANVDDIESIMPELPLRRVAVDNFTTTDLSTAESIDVSISYDNSRGSRVDAQLVGNPPLKAEKKRNGRTFNHSQNQVLAVLDIPAQESLFKADVTVEGKGLGMKRIGGIVPARFVQQQAQGGLAIGTYQVVPNGPASGGPSYGDVMVSVAGGGPVEAAPELDAETMVKMSVAQNFSTVKGCYLTRVEEEGADIAGDMTIGFTISEGVVTEVTVGEGTLSDDALTACITTAVQGWGFDTSVNGSASWPFTFVGADADGTPADVVLGDGTLDLEGSDEDVLEDLDDEIELGEDLEEMEEMEDDEGSDVLDSKSLVDLNAASIHNFSTVHKMPSGNEVTMKWLVSQKGERVTAVQTTPLRTLTYNYRLVSDHYLELVSVTVEQYGRATPVTAITFNPPLPDVRWPFNGRRTSDFVIDVNGQRNHGLGQVDVFWTETGPKLKVNPMEPSWTKNRVMQTSIIFQRNGEASIAIERIGE